MALVARTVDNGTGTDIDALVDDGATADMPLVKLAVGTVGSEALIPGDSTRGLSTDNRFLCDTITVTPTVSTSPAYTAKDAVGGIMTFAGAARANGGTGRITRVTILDKGQQMKDLTLLIWNTSPTAATDNSIYAPTDAAMDPSLYVGAVPISAGMYEDLSTNSVATWTGVIPFECAAGSAALYGVLVARGTPTYTSTSDIVVGVFVEQD
jgi:hypothetical protein